MVTAMDMAVVTPPTQIGMVVAKRVLKSASIIVENVLPAGIESDISRTSRPEAKW